MNDDKKVKILRYSGAFFIPMVIYILVLIIGRCYPFGSRNFLYSDAYYQYYSMFKELINWLHTEDKSLFLWNRGMGVDFYLNMVYYCFSPFTFIIILFGEAHLKLGIIFTIILKISCIGLSSLYFFDHTNKNREKEKDSIRIPFILDPAFLCALAFALSGYVIAYGHNIIWLDGLILLPLLALGIEKMVEQGKILLYFISLTLILIINFYFGFFLCIFAVFYFFLEEKKSFIDMVKKGAIFAISSIMAALCAGFVLIPAAFGIMNAPGQSDTLGNNTFRIFGNLGKFWESFYPFGEVDGMGPDTYNINNYCGFVLLFFAILFFLNKNVTLKKKIKYGVAVLVLVLSLNYLYPNYVLHGFAFTHGMGNRFAFIFTFLVILMGFICINNINQISKKSLIMTMVIMITISVISFAFNKDKTVAFAYVGVFSLIIFSIMLLVLFWRKSIKANTFYIWISALLLFEILGNAIKTAPEKTIDDDYMDMIHLSSWQSMYDDIEVDLGERKTALSDMIYVCKSNSDWYSSMNNKGTVESFKALGLSHYSNVEYTYRGTTPLTALMYNVRYVVSPEKGMLGGYHEIQQKNGYSLYESDNSGGMGFAINEDALSLQLKGDGAENQNEITKYGFGVSDDLFEEINSHDADVFLYNMEEISRQGMKVKYKAVSNYHPNVRVEFKADKDMDVYLWGSDTREQGMEVKVDGKVTVSMCYADSQSLVHIGKVKKGQLIQINHYSSLEIGDIGVAELKIYSFDEQVFNEVKKAIMDEPLCCKAVKGNEMDCEINMWKDGLIYIAIPYNPGFSVYVDGKKTAVEKLGTGLMAVKADSGSHGIVIKYKTPGLRAGIFVSIAGVFLSILFGIIYRKKESYRDL